GRRAGRSRTSRRGGIAPERRLRGPMLPSAASSRCPFFVVRCPFAVVRCPFFVVRCPFTFAFRDNGQRRTENEERIARSRCSLTAHGERRTENGQRRTQNGQRAMHQSTNMAMPAANIATVVTPTTICVGRELGGLCMIYRSF